LSFINVKLKLSILLSCLCAILPEKAVFEMTYAVSGGTLNPTDSLIHCHEHSFCRYQQAKVNCYSLFASYLTCWGILPIHI